MIETRKGVSAAALAMLLGACVGAPKELPSTGNAPVATNPTGTSTASRPSTGRVPAGIPPAPPPPSFANPTVMNLPGLVGVIGETAGQLRRTFGEPRLDVMEGDARKMQFTGQACVLDVYLYPLRPGATPTATHLEARRASDGFEVDRVACANALKR